MDRKNYFGHYKLSQATLAKLHQVEDLLERDLYPSNPSWAIIKPKQEVKNEQTEDEEPSSEFKEPENNEDAGAESAPLSSTQFYFSQKQTTPNPPTTSTVEPVNPRWSDVAQSLYETLENTNETLTLENLTKLSDKDVDGIIKCLSTKLGLKGTYNLCHSVCAMDMDQGMIYIRIICRHLLLQKIIDLDGSSRLMTSVIQELVKTFPDDIQEFVYIPILNAELKDTTVVSVMISSFDPQRKNDLITNFLNTVHEIKEWHLIILSQLINTKLADNGMKEKLLKLLMEKASRYSRDKNYGKFVLSFVKLNAPFTEEQKSSLNEIVAVNETIFKRVMENLMKNMYFYGDLWHIS